MKRFFEVVARYGSFRCQSRKLRIPAQGSLVCHGKAYHTCGFKLHKTPESVVVNLRWRQQQRDKKQSKTIQPNSKKTTKR